MPKAVKRAAGDSKQKKKPRKKSKTSTEKVTEPLEKIKLKPYPQIGELLFCGGTNWDLTGRWKLPKSATREGSKPPAGGRNLFGPHRLSALTGIRVRNVVSGPHANHSIIITEEGKALSWGRNEQEQLGLGHAERVDSPTLIETLKNKHIVNAACGRTHSLCLTDEGSVYAFGDNRLGQLGIGCQSASVGTPCKIDYRGSPIVQVACGGEFSMILDCKGSLHSFGCQEYSQLGHNSNGRFAVKGTKSSSQNITSPRKVVLEKIRDGSIRPLENTVMKDVVCGGNHTVAMDMQSRIFTWGFGGYGRLGHGEPRDEPVPRSLKFFEPQNSGRTAAKIYAGSSYSMVVCTNGQLFFWGQTKSTGEATMYPKPIHDLSGWKIRSVGCSNSSIVIAAEESIISWGPSPTYGELGYGDNASRSSTHPQKAKPLEGFHIYKVACGYGHTLMIAQDDREEDKVRISKVPIFDPRMAQSIPGTPYVPKPTPVVEETKEETKEESPKESETMEVGKSEAVESPANGSVESHPSSTETEKKPTEEPSVDPPTNKQKAVEPDEVVTKPDTVEIEPDTVETKMDVAETKPAPVVTKPDVVESKSDSVVMKGDVAEAEPQTASKNETKSTKEDITTSQESKAAQDEEVHSPPDEPMDMSMPDKKPPVANGVGEKPVDRATVLPPPSNEPLNLTMGGGPGVEQTPAIKNILPPPPVMNSHLKLSPQLQERTSCIKKVSRDGTIEPSSNGAILP